MNPELWEFIKVIGMLFAGIVILSIPAGFFLAWFEMWLETKKMREPCIYGECRARNLCVRNHCVGRALLENDNYIIEKGTMRDATPDEKKQLLTGKSDDE